MARIPLLPWVDAEPASARPYRRQRADVQAERSAQHLAPSGGATTSTRSCRTHERTTPSPCPSMWSENFESTCLAAILDRASRAFAAALLSVRRLIGAKRASTNSSSPRAVEFGRSVSRHDGDRGASRRCFDRGAGDQGSNRRGDAADLFGWRCRQQVSCQARERSRKAGCGDHRSARAGQSVHREPSHPSIVVDCGGWVRSPRSVCNLSRSRRSGTWRVRTSWR